VILRVGSFINPQHIFRAFKYVVYLLLTTNIFLFFQEESLATAQTFSQGIDWVDVIQGFASTIDTTAWVLLLLLFEFETSILDDQTLRQSKVQAFFITLRTFCYGFILYASYGYISKVLLLHNISPVVIADLCNQLGQGFSSIITIDEYPPLDAQSCATLANQELYRLDGQQVIGSASDWTAIQWLAWVDVTNSLAWIAVVIILEIDVWLQLRGRLEGRFVSITQLIKLVLYAILFGAAVYWGLLGDFLDFWDAFLWLVAFVFIEMNIFQWQAETNAETSIGAEVV
jgi:hypothetical protein